MRTKFDIYGFISHINTKLFIKSYNLFLS